MRRASRRDVENWQRHFWASVLRESCMRAAQSCDGFRLAHAWFCIFTQSHVSDIDDFRAKALFLRTAAARVPAKESISSPHHLCLSFESKMASASYVLRGCQFHPRSQGIHRNQSRHGRNWQRPRSPPDFRSNVVWRSPR